MSGQFSMLIPNHFANASLLDFHTKYVKVNSSKVEKTHYAKIFKGKSSFHQAEMK